MTRREFTKRVRLDAWDRCGGNCDKCTAKITAANGPPQYDHIVPDALGGEPTLENCQVLCRNCHGVKTSGEDVPRIAKAKRGHAKRINAQPRTRAFRRPVSVKYDWRRGRYTRPGADDT